MIHSSTRAPCLRQVTDSNRSNNSAFRQPLASSAAFRTGRRVWKLANLALVQMLDLNSSGERLTMQIAKLGSRKSGLMLGVAIGPIASRNSRPPKRPQHHRPRVCLPVPEIVDWVVVLSRCIILKLATMWYLAAFRGPAKGHALPTVPPATSKAVDMPRAP